MYAKVNRYVDNVSKRVIFGGFIFLWVVSRVHLAVRRSSLFLVQLKACWMSTTSSTPIKLMVKIDWYCVSLDPLQQVTIISSYCLLMFEPINVPRVKNIKAVDHKA
ncbi:hypothetical protein OK016_27400 [Vibrio chagasii]|nr:hypothetical protein [Vibrio chagasii]